MRGPIVFLLAATTLFASSLLAQHGYTQADVEAGQRLFGANCVGCHGPDGDLIPGVDFGHGKFSRVKDDDDIVKIVRDGIPGTPMPAGKFTEIQAGTLVAYLRSMTSATAVTSTAIGDATRGAAIFEGKGNCTNCHRANGKGSHVGPDLSDIGGYRRVVQLETSLLDPDAEVLPQNRYYRVVLKDGTAVTGRLLNQDAFSVQMIDTRERMATYEKAKLKEFAFVGKSPMPAYKGKLTTQELADVIGYLVSLKGAQAR